VKRRIHALSFAVLAIPLLAATCESFEPLDLDHALQNVAEGRMIGVDYPFGSFVPHDEISLAAEALLETNALQQRT